MLGLEEEGSDPMMISAGDESEKKREAKRIESGS